MKKTLTLVINAGSSSLKFRLFNEKLKEVAEGLIEKIGLPGSFFDYQVKKTEDTLVVKIKDHKEALSLVLQVLENNKIDFSLINKIGHRVVHGGEKYIKPTLITKRVLIDLKTYNKLAPLHNPNNIAGIEACMK